MLRSIPTTHAPEGVLGLLAVGSGSAHTGRVGQRRTVPTGHQETHLPRASPLLVLSWLLFFQRCNMYPGIEQETMQLFVLVRWDFWAPSVLAREDLCLWLCLGHRPLRIAIHPLCLSKLAQEIYLEAGLPSS